MRRHRHVYLIGTDLGSAFAPPAVYLGINAQAECKVQSFTSAKNKLHCIIAAEGLPQPLPTYSATGSFVSLPFRVIKNGRLADCWHIGGINHACFARFDVGGTPRLRRVLTSTVESGGLLRLSGQGIDGGLSGVTKLQATLFRGDTPVLGSCGEKDCQASSMGADTLGCYSRPDAGGDGVSGATQASQLATAFSDASNFGCVLDAIDGGLSGGLFNVSLHAINDEYHRGDVYLGFLDTRRLDVASVCRRAHSSATTLGHHLATPPVWSDPTIPCAPLSATPPPLPPLPPTLPPSLLTVCVACVSARRRACRSTLSCPHASPA